MSKVKPFVFNLRLTEKEGKEIKEGASNSNLSMNEYLRVRLFNYATTPEDQDKFERSRRKFKFKNKIATELVYLKNDSSVDTPTGISPVATINNSSIPIVSSLPKVAPPLSSPIVNHDLEEIYSFYTPTAIITSDMDISTTADAETLVLLGIDPSVIDDPWMDSGVVVRSANNPDDEVIVTEAYGSFGGLKLMTRSEWKRCNAER